MKVCLGGDTLAYREQVLTLNRTGRPEQVWLDLDYSPVLDESGEPAGVVAIVIETTAKVAADRWRAGERDRQRQMFEQAPGFMARHFERLFAGPPPKGQSEAVATGILRDQFADLRKGIFISMRRKARRSRA